MNLEIATTLKSSLNSFKGTKSIDGQVVMKFLITPRDEYKQKEYLKVYHMNKWNEHGLIVDCYRNEDLTIIVQFELPYPTIKYQQLRDFLLKRKLD